MIVRDTKPTQPLVNIETLPFGSYILYNELIGVIFPYRRFRHEIEYTSFAIHLLTDSELSFSGSTTVFDVPKGTKVLPIKIKTIEYEAIERNPYDYG